MSISKETLIEALRIFKAEIQSEMLGTIVEALHAAGSSAATEPEPIETNSGDTNVKE